MAEIVRKHFLPWFLDFGQNNSFSNFTRFSKLKMFSAVFCRLEDFFITTENYPESLAPCMVYAHCVGRVCGIVDTCPLWSVWAITKMTCALTTAIQGPLYTYILLIELRQSLLTSHDNNLILMTSHPCDTLIKKNRRCQSYRYIVWVLEFQKWGK